MLDDLYVEELDDSYLDRLKYEIVMREKGYTEEEMKVIMYNYDNIIPLSTDLIK